jgi:predicted lipid-binding transport protein (Tim44 family)
VAGLAAGFLLGYLVLVSIWQEPIDAGFGLVVLPGVVVFAAVRFLLRRRRANPDRPAPVVVAPPTGEPPCPVRDTDLDQGVHEIRRADRGFDAERFAGYAAMMFRDVHRATIARDASALRDRVTPSMYGELEARSDRLRTSGRSVHVAALDVTAQVTEAWQDGTRDYVTAYVAGSLEGHTVDDATGQVVGGPPAPPGSVAAFLTFTRPSGLNFWMLSLIQEA